MATKLSIFNDALRAIGDLRLVSTSDDIEARYALDDAWVNGITYVFTEGLWNFASKTAKITYNSGLTPIPGFSYGYDKPADWLRTIVIAPNSLFDTEIFYRDEGGKFYSNSTEMYIRYISNALAVDGSVTTWPATFARMVSAYLAAEAGERISGSAEKGAELKAAYKDALAKAKNIDALDQAKLLLRPGNWLRAMSGRSNSRDRGPLSGY